MAAEVVPDQDPIREDVPGPDLDPGLVLAPGPGPDPSLDPVPSLDPGLGRQRTGKRTDAPEEEDPDPEADLGHDPGQDLDPGAGRTTNNDDLNGDKNQAFFPLSYSGSSL